MPIIQIATDGSCIQPGGWRDGDPRPRPGAAAFILERHDGALVRFAQPKADTTIGRMEMTALAAALDHVLTLPAQPGLSYQVLCDSQFVVNGYNDWMAGWAAKNFTKKGGLANADLWQRIHTLKGRLANMGVEVSVAWVKGHSGNRLNHLVDELANTCARTQVAVDDTPTSPQPVTTEFAAVADPTDAGAFDDTGFADTPARQLSEAEKAEQLALLIALDTEVTRLYANLFHLGTGSHFHAFIEWCGVLAEHLNIVRDLVAKGVPAMNMNRHTGESLPIPGYQLAYLAEKIECIFDGAILVRTPANIEDARKAWIDHLRKLSYCDSDRADEIRAGREDSESFIEGYLSRG